MTTLEVPLSDRCQRIRALTCALIYHAGSGHPGGSLSCVDLLTWLWNDCFADDPPGAELGDQFILSKGHACPALYAVGQHFGLLPMSEMTQLRALGSKLQGHPHVADLPWVGTSTGSLGQGFSVAVGRALGLRVQEDEGRTYVLLGDGELQEGECWEAAMSAAHFGLDHLTAIVDYNGLQSDDSNANIMGLEPLTDKWQSFGWKVLVIDGHDLDQIEAAFATARTHQGQPTVLIANTTKGKGVSYMEDSPLWHGSVKLRDEEFATALGELGISADEIPSWIDGSVFA
ncbi:MAG: transketolase [Planctomycetota bacterium]|jgi:transketolase